VAVGAPWFSVVPRDGPSTQGAGQRGLGSGDKCALCWALLPGPRPRYEACAQATFGICRLGTLAEGYYSTRLETRTKESNMYASRWAANP
jgi:hypothetical protein